MNKNTNAFLHNFFHLSLLRIISHILPLISTPFLLKAIGVKEFGVLELCKTTTMYFTAFVSYGFRYSAAKQITLHQQDKCRIGQIISSVYVIQVIFIAVSILLMAILIICIPALQHHATFLINFFPIVITSGLFPTFIFQGMNIMKWLVGINLVAKLLFLCSVLLFIHQPSDAILFPRFLAGIDVFRLLASLVVVYKYQKIHCKCPRLAIMMQQLKEGVNIFLSILATMFYARFPVTFLGFFVGPEAVGIYSLGEKITKATEGMLEPAMQALYPISHCKLQKNLEQGLQYLWQFAKKGFVILLGVGMLCAVFADPIMCILMGTDIPAAVQVFKIQAFVAAIMLLSNILGMHVLIPLKAGHLYTAAIVITGLVAAGLHRLLIPAFSTQGAASAVLISELVLLLLLGFSARHTVKKARLEAPKEKAIE